MATTPHKTGRRPSSLADAQQGCLYSCAFPHMRDVFVSLQRICRRASAVQTGKVLPLLSRGCCNVHLSNTAKLQLTLASPCHLMRSFLHSSQGAFLDLRSIILWLGSSSSIKRSWLYIQELIVEMKVLLIVCFVLYMILTRLFFHSVAPRINSDPAIQTPQAASGNVKPVSYTIKIGVVRFLNDTPRSQVR